MACSGRAVRRVQAIGDRARARRVWFGKVHRSEDGYDKTLDLSEMNGLGAPRPGRGAPALLRPSRPGEAYNRAMALSLRSYEPHDFAALYRLDQSCFPAGISYE